MGQRTQMVVEVVKTVEDYSTEKKTKKTYLGSYHNQWGIAKMQLLDVMRFVTSYQDGFSKDAYVMPERLHKGFLMDDESVFKGKATPERVIDWLNKQDNNNGGLLLKLNVDNFDYIQSGELYIFNDPEHDYDEAVKANGGNEDGVDYSEVNRIISFMDYVTIFPEYFNPDFITAFTALMRFYNIKIVEPKTD